MISSLTERLTQEVLNNYPFPIAFVFKEAVLNATDEERRVRGIIQTFTTGVQYAAMIYACEYARADYREESLSWGLDRLKRPLISDFFHFVSAAAPSFRQHGISPLLSEGEVFGTQIEQTRATLPVGVDNSPREQPPLLSKVLIDLRNMVAHKIYQANWAQLAEQHLPLLLAFLRAMEWSARYPLLRIVGDDQMVRLMGATMQSSTEPIPEAAQEELAHVRVRGDFSGLMLADATSSRFLNLYPLVVIAPCAGCQADPLSGLTEEVFLFNGDEGRQVTYLGVRHKRNTDARDDIDVLYDSKKTRPPVIRVNQITPPELSKRATWQSEQLLEANISARRYLPQIYHPRPEMEAALQGFRRGHRVGFCLLGEAGIGKTSLLCRKLEEWSGRRTSVAHAEGAAGEVVLFYEGKGLFVGGNLEERIMNDLYLEGTFQELLNRLRPTGRRLIIIIDGVNEDVAPPRTLQTLCQFIVRYGLRATQNKDHAPLQVVFSFRSAFYDKTLRALDYAGDGDEMRDLLPPHIFFTREVEQLGQKKQTYRFVLGSMSATEAGTVYEDYRAFEGTPEATTGKARRFRPLTPFEDLSTPTRRLLTHPWYLRMVMESFDGRQVPPTLWAGELLREFCLIKIYGKSDEQRRLFYKRSAFADALVKLMRRGHTGVVECSDLPPPPLLQDELLESYPPRSPYLQLLDEGVLMETVESQTIGGITRTRQFTRFAFDTLFEYLLSQDILREAGDWENLTGEHLASLIETSEDFGHLYGAVELLMVEAAQHGNYPLLADTLAAAGRVIVPLFIDVLETIEGLQYEHFEKLLDLLTEDGDVEQSLMILINTSHKFGEKLRLGAMLACTVRAEGIGRKLTGETRDRLVHALGSALMNKGAALNKLGHLLEAINSYDEAIAIFKSLVKEQGQFDVAGKLAMVLMNRGVALLNLKRLSEAHASLEEAISIFRWIVEDQGLIELSDQFATALMNKATLLLKLGRLSEAIAVCDEVIAIFRQLVEAQGRTELANQLARALTNKGVALRGSGLFSEAVTCYDEAIATYRLLVEEQGVSGFAVELAKALMNKGVALFMSGHESESTSYCEEAVTIYRRLVGEQNHIELTSGLALALMNEAASLIMVRRLPEAIVVCEETVTIYEQLVGQQKRLEFSSDLAKAQMIKGNALRDSGRLDEAIASYDDSLAIYRLLMEEQGRTELAGDLCMLLVNRGMSLSRSLRLPEAIATFDDAIAIYTWLVKEMGRPELANELALAMLEKGVALMQTDRQAEAIAINNEAIAIYRGLVEEQGRSDLVETLAKALLSQSQTLGSSYRWAESFESYIEATLMWKRLVEEDGRADLNNRLQLALALSGKGTTLASLNRLPESLVCLDEAISLCRSLVEEQGNPNLDNTLALALSNKGMVLDSSNRLEEAVKVCFEAVAICTAQLRKQWRPELAITHALSLMNAGNALRRSDSLPVAIASYDEAVAIYRSLIGEHRRISFAAVLATALTNRGLAHNSAAHLDEAMSDWGEVIAILQKLIGEGRHELLGQLAMVLLNHGLAANSLGRFPEALVSSDSAINIYKPFIRQGQQELVTA